MMSPELTATLSFLGIVVAIFVFFIATALNDLRKRKLHREWVEKSIPIRDRFWETCDKVRVMTRWAENKQVWFIQVARVPHPRDHYWYDYKADYEPIIYWTNLSSEVYYTESEAITVARNMAHSYFEGAEEVAIM